MSLCFLQNVDVLKDPDAVRQLASILKTNVRACKALMHPYVIQVKFPLLHYKEIT